MQDLLQSDHRAVVLDRVVTTQNILSKRDALKPRTNIHLAAQS